MSADSKRKFTRVPFETEIKVTSGDAVIASSLVRNISLGGIFIETREPLPVGAHCAVNLDLIGPASSLKIRVEGEVVRLEENGVALNFTKIESDSLIHLRHLIKIYAEEPETIDEEYFQELFKIEPGP